MLAIETSCDDTGIAILEAQGDKAPVFKVLSNVVSSQQIHANYGGVFPIMAKREHQTNLVPVLVQSLKEAGLLQEKPSSLNEKELDLVKKILEKESGLYEFTKVFLETHEKPDVNYIVVTHGPGLEPCLWVGVNFAKALSAIWNIPVIPVNHIEAHILVNQLNADIEFPALSLVVSGGHTQLILVKDIGSYEIIGETKDDAAGECFDKAARILDLGYPGGPIISKIAAKYAINPKPDTLKLPRPMIHSKDYNFSFSGLKTAVLYKIRDTDPKTVKNPEFIQEMCFAVQDAICDVLVKKTLQAAKDRNVKTIILGGGVSANSELRKQFELNVKGQLSNVKMIFPEPKLSTDNGLMIAVAGYFNRNKKVDWNGFTVDANLRVGE
jgi:N6-L-threonylcarbamoyladenine synthase